MLNVVLLFVKFFKEDDYDLSTDVEEFFAGAFFVFADKSSLLIVVAKALGDRADVDAEDPVWSHLQLGHLVLACNLVVQVSRETDDPLLLCSVNLAQRGFVHRSVFLLKWPTSLLFLLCQCSVLQDRESRLFLI